MRNLKIAIKIFTITMLSLVVISCGNVKKDEKQEVSSKQNALEVISHYAETGEKKPTLQDYVDAGIEGVSETNIDVINAEIQHFTPDEVDTSEEIQMVIDSVEEVSDRVKPIITLVGSSNLTLTVGDTYRDAGAKARDNIDGDISSKIRVVGRVNTTLVGLYTITYNVIDSSGNRAIPVKRIIKVVEKAEKDSNNTIPIAQAQLVQTKKNASLDITLSGSDSDGDALTYVVVDSPEHGTLTGSGKNLTYIPNSDYVGTDSFTFKVNDGKIDSSTSTIQITVKGVEGVASSNHVPTATAQTLETTLETSLDVTLSGEDSDGDSLTYSVIKSPSHGTLTGSGKNLTYVPKQDYVGHDQLTFKVNDGKADSETVIVDFVIFGKGTKIIAIPQTVNVLMNEEIYITLTGVDINKKPIQYLLNTGAKDGDFSLSGRILYYKPNRDFLGVDKLEFLSISKTGRSVPAIIKFNVYEDKSINQSPYANNIYHEVKVNSSAINIHLLASDRNKDTVTYEIKTQPSHGVLKGSGQDITYQPNSDYVGTDKFTYIANDGQIDSNIATVKIKINDDADAALNCPPSNDKTGSCSKYELYGDNHIAVRVLDNQIYKNLADETGSFGPYNLVQDFYSEFGDDFDFLFVILNKPLPISYKGKMFLVKNDVTGIGALQDKNFNPPRPQISVEDHSNLAGTSGKLKSFMFLPPGMENLDQYIISRQFYHELSHNWENYWMPKWCGGNSPGHYGKYSSINSNVGGVGWIEESELEEGETRPAGLNSEFKKFTADVSGHALNGSFNNVTLYLMGLIPASELQPVRCLKVGKVVDVTQGLEDQMRIASEKGVEFEFKYTWWAKNMHEMSPDEILFYLEHDADEETYDPDANVTIIGRSPAFGQAQTEFKSAFLIVTSEDMPVNESLIKAVTAEVEKFGSTDLGDKTSRFYRHRMNSFYDATGGRGTMQTGCLQQARICN